jgi:hypothetical protein
MIVRQGVRHTGESPTAGGERISQNRRRQRFASTSGCTRSIASVMQAGSPRYGRLGNLRHIRRAGHATKLYEREGGAPFRA